MHFPYYFEQLSRLLGGGTYPSAPMATLMDVNDHRFGHLTSLLSLHYFVKCRLLSLLLAWHQRLPLAFMLEENILSTCCNKDDVT